MSTIDTTIDHGVYLGSTSYPSPLTITNLGAVDVAADSNDLAVEGLGVGNTLINEGTVDGTGSVAGVYLPGGSVNNSGYIGGHLSGVQFGVDLGTLTNSGTIESTGDRDYFGTARYDVTFGDEGNGGGTLQNNAGGDITGGVGSLGGAITVTNLGTITNDFGQGVSLNYGGTVIDAGTISSSGPIGPGDPDYLSIYFGGTFFSNTATHNLLNLEAGYSLTGGVRGSDIAGSTNTLELTGSAGAPVTVNFTPATFTNFNDVEFAPDDAPNYGKLIIATAADEPATITGFTGPHDVIDLGFISDVDDDATATLNPTTDVLTIIGDNGTQTTLQLDTSENYSGITFIATPDGSGTDITPACFCAGALIETPSGETAVEALRIGDLVTTLSGEARPIKWIGQRSYAARFINAHHRAALLPVRVAAGALAENVPSRDLCLSPEHALALDDHLIPAGRLLNGTSITRLEEVETIHYFHIELEAHGVLLAEGAPAESFLDTGNRNLFANVLEYLALGLEPGAAVPCLPYALDGPVLDRVRLRLAARAATLGMGTTDDPGLRLLVDGRVLRAESVEGEEHCFAVPAGARELRLLSRSAVPAELDPASPDRRRLGVLLREVALHADRGTARMKADAALFGRGFHAPEESLRWTDGDARLPAELIALAAGAAFTLELRVAAHLPRYPAQSEVVAFAAAAKRRRA